MVTAYEGDDSSSRRTGALALAFANAEGMTLEGGDVPLPGVAISPAGLDAWLRDRGILPSSCSTATLSPPVLHGLHSDALRLHRAVHALLRGVAEERAPDEVTCFEINRVLEAAAWHRALDPGRQKIVERFRPSSAHGLLAPIALDAAALAEAAPGRRLRTCAAEACARWFLDTSKGGRRRWCSMATCGNRAKAARWRERHASDR